MHRTNSFLPAVPPTFPARRIDSRPSSSRRKIPFPIRWPRANPLPPGLHFADWPSRGPRPAGLLFAARPLAGSLPLGPRLPDPLHLAGLARPLFRRSPATRDAGPALRQTPAGRSARPRVPRPPTLRLLPSDALLPPAPRFLHLPVLPQLFGVP